jgi:hypothetical protein
MTKIAFSSAVMVMGALACINPAAAKPPTVHDRVKKELETVLRIQEAANAAGEDGEKLARHLYTDDIAIAGEGDPHIKHGLAVAIEETEGWRKSLPPGAQARCKFELREPLVASEHAAASFVILRCKGDGTTAAPDSVTRMMYVWRRTPVGWRVALEMWSEGDY